VRTASSTRSHECRRDRWHAFATSLLRHGEDNHVAQRLLGHSDIATTTRYLQLSDVDLMDAVDRASPAD